MLNNQTKPTQALTGR